MGQSQQAMAPLAEHLRRQADAIQAARGPVVEQFQKSAQVRPAVMAYLIDRSWFVTMNFLTGWFVCLDEWRLAYRHGEVDTAMADFARGQTDDTERLLCERFSARAVILADACAAHREGRYALSVPILLAQADGTRGGVTPGG